MPSALIRACALAAIALVTALGQPAVAQTIRVERLIDGPIIRPEMDGSMGSNIAGPSLIRVPDWIENPLGRYYLYFADHRGTYIRLAYANTLIGPWTTYEPGTLQLDQSHFPTTCPPCSSPAYPAGSYIHIASPDVHVRDAQREIVMYVHGRDVGRQVTRLAVSTDGLHFAGRPEVLGHPYFRAFRHEGFVYALAMPGVMYRSRDGMTGFEEGPRLFNPDMRHSALLTYTGVTSVVRSRAWPFPLTGCTLRDAPRCSGTRISGRFDTRASSTHWRCRGSCTGHAMA